MTLPLAELQQHVAHYCLHGNMPNTIPLAGEPSLHTKRLDIYATNVQSSAIEALASVFETVSALVGEEFFTAMAQRYVVEQPPHTGCFYEYGTTFPDFIATFAPAASLPYLEDAASYDWAWHQAYSAADDTALQLETLQHMTEEQPLTLRANVALVKARYPAAELWAFAKGEQDAPDIEEGEHYYMLHRPKLDVARHTITADFFAALESFTKGATLSESCNVAATLNEETDSEQLLRSLFALALLAEPV